MSINQSSPPQLSQNPTAIFSGVDEPQPLMLQSSYANELAPFQHPYLPVEAAIQAQTDLQRYPILLVLETDDSPEERAFRQRVTSKSLLSECIYCVLCKAFA